MAPKGPNIVEVNEANFDAEVLKSPLPFLLDVSGEHCQPCKALAPTLEALAKEYEGKVRFGTLDVQESPRVATRFQVRSIPTLLLFTTGEVISQLTGLQPRQKLVDMLHKAL